MEKKKILIFTGAGVSDFIFNISEEKKYLPDFYISGLNLIIEIKSTYYFNLHKEKNIKKIESVKDNGYNFILILDKNYKEFKEFYEKNIDFHRSWC